MKGMKMLGILAISSLVLTGCQDTNDTEDALKKQITQLEQQIANLEKENKELSSTSSTDVSDDDINTLTKTVDEIIKRANNTSANGTKDENQKKFFELKSKMQDVEDRLEHYEDKVEDDYRQGNLSYEKARETEIEIEHLEDKLDTAKDRLENIFGYDD